MFDNACLVSVFRKAIKSVVASTAAIFCVNYFFSSLDLWSEINERYGLQSCFAPTVLFLLVFLFPGGPHVATSRRLADVDASAGAPALRRIDRGGLRARAEDHHPGPSADMNRSLIIATLYSITQSLNQRAQYPTTTHGVCGVSFACASPGIHSGIEQNTERYINS